MDATQQQGGSGLPPPFLVKTYDMIDDPSTNKIVSWSQTERSFVVWSPLEFARDLLPKYFKHNNFSSFIRQLNTYGFRKKDPDLWEFQNDEFIRGKKHLLKNIHRRKPIHSHTLHHQGEGSSGLLSDSEKQELEERIENLKRDNRDLQHLIQQRQETEQNIQSLKKRLYYIQCRQQQLMSFLAQAVQKPNFLSNFILQSKIQGKKRRFPKSDLFGGDVDTGENGIMNFPTIDLEKPEIIPMQISEVESSLSSLEKLVHEAACASSEETCDHAITELPLAGFLSELHASSGDSDVNMHSQSPNTPPCNFGDINDSSSELAESADYSGSPVIATACPMETRLKVNDIDVNSEPVIPEASLSGDRSAGVSPATVASGANDVFWQQFLTETPGDAQEVQSDRRDGSARKNEMKATELGAFWLTRKNVDHLTEQT